MSASVAWGEGPEGVAAGRGALRGVRGALAVLAAVGATWAVGVPSSGASAGLPMSDEAARTYGLDWIPHIDPADLPPAPAVTCLVDSGVSVTPLLPADAPDGPVVERATVFSDGDGTGGASWAEQHGTRMASFAAVSPATRILSVRAMPRGSEVFPVGAYEQASERCRRAAVRWPVSVIQLSLGCGCVLTAEETAGLRDAVASRRERGLSVVASAGNRAGAPEPAASLAGVVPAVAGDGYGEVCDYAAQVAGGIVGPGCDSVDPTAGSSTAAAAVALTAALLRSVRPGATPDEIASWLRAAPAGADDLHRLDAAAALVAAGRGDVVARARDRARAGSATAAAGLAPATPTPPAAAVPVTTDGLTATPHLAPVPRPRLGRVTARWRRGRLVVERRDHRRGDTLHVRVEQRVADGRATTVRRARGGRRVVVRTRRAPVRVVLRVASGGRSSATRVLRPGAGGRYR